MRLSWHTALAYLLAWVMALNTPILLFGAPQVAAVPGGPARPATPIQVPPTPGDLIEDWGDMFEALFGVPYDQDEWTYPLDLPVTGEGTYSGQNHLGQPFELEVMVFAPTPIQTLGLTPAQLQILQDANYTISAVIGTLSTGLATIPVSGSVISTEDATHPLDVRFAPGELLDPENPLFQPPPLPLMSGGEDFGGFPIFCFPIPIFCSDDACRDDCVDDYNEKVEDAQEAYDAAADDANDAYDLAEQQAQIAQDAAVATANSNYAGEVANAKDTMGIGLAACAITLNVAITYCALASVFTWYTFGLATVACIAAAHIAAAACTSAVMTNFAINMATASNNLTTALNNAQIAYDAAIDSAQAALESALADAQEDLDEALADAEAELEDCLEGCIYICGWLFICIYMY